MENLQLNTEYLIFGKPSEFSGRINVVHPDMEIEDAEIAFQDRLDQLYTITFTYFIFFK